MIDPVAAVAVPTRDRPVRLRWLLNALADQELEGAAFEVVVAFDPSSAETHRLLQSHPLTAARRLRAVPRSPESDLAGAARNLAWRATRAPLILFTDDDCRPRSDWFVTALAAARREPGAIIQGRTRPDPDEAAILRAAPWARTVSIDPPTAWCETCNIAYPRAVLERTGGFDERMDVGEDTDLSRRACKLGTRVVAEPAMVVYHAVEDLMLWQLVAASRRWRDMALLVRLHPELREALTGRVFWKPEHAALPAAAAALLAGRRHPAALLGVLPWLALSSRHRGFGPRGLARSALELPGRVAIDATEMLTLARGSVRYRTLLL